jgi:ligand-binding SRPBCC domain-containing protein
MGSGAFFFWREVQALGPTRCSSRKGFEFHADPHNIGKVSPRGLSVEVLASHPQARAGDQFTLRVRQLGIPLLWRGQWEKVESPSLLVDSAKVFPFSYWRHEHRFTAANSETEMTITCI